MTSSTGDGPEPRPLHLDRLLVAAHGTDKSYGAVRWATAIADRVGAWVDVVDACGAHDPEMDAIESEAHLREIRDRLTGHLAERGLRVRNVVVEHGEIAEVVGRVDPDDTDLVVLGTHRFDGTAARSTEVFAQLARATQCPLAIVPPGDWGDPSMPVMVGVDGSDTNRGVFRWARWIAPLLDRRVVAVYVSDPLVGTFVSGEQLDDEQTEVRREIEHTDVEFVERVDADPGASLAEYAAIRSAGLLVVGARVHHSFGGRLLGGVTAQIVETANCPVIVLPRAFRLRHD